MVVIKSTGGFGNQLFFYALYIYLTRLGHDVLIDTSYYSFVKNFIKRILLIISFNKLRNKVFLREFIIGKFLNLKKIREFKKIDKALIISEIEVMNGLVELSDLDHSKVYYLVGGWQNTRLITKDFTEIVLSCFKPNDTKNLQILSIIESSESVGIHVRRTDLLSSKNNVLEKDYYFSSINYLMKKFKDISLTFFVFSDDISWSRENFAMPNVSFIDWNFLSPEIDFYLFSRCKNQIIANSTFSWWGAYLNPNPNKNVLAPSHWSEKVRFENTDLNVSNWVTID
jgi:hypothetical protein